MAGQLGSRQINATQGASGCYYIGNHLRTLLEPSIIYTSNFITIAQELEDGFIFGPDNLLLLWLLCSHHGNR